MSLQQDFGIGERGGGKGFSEWHRNKYSKKSAGHKKFQVETRDEKH